MLSSLSALSLASGSAAERGGEGGSDTHRETHDEAVPPDVEPGARDSHRAPHHDGGGDGGADGPSYIEKEKEGGGGDPSSFSWPGISRNPCGGWDWWPGG